MTREGSSIFVVQVRQGGSRMSKYKNLVLLGGLVFLLSGCAPAVSYRANPRFQEQARQMHTIAILPSKVRVYQIDAGGAREEIAEWSAQAQSNVIFALENELRTKMKAAVKVVSEESLVEEKPRFQETRALYDAVSTMISLHTYPNPNNPSLFFEEKQKNFDYSLGSEVGSLANGAEALLFFNAEDHVWTGGRQALQALGVILGVGVTVMSPPGPVIPRMSGGTAVKAALIDSATGDILWINAVGAGAGKDLRDSASASAMVSELFKDFPLSYGSGTNEQESH